MHLSCTTDNWNPGACVYHAVYPLQSSEDLCWFTGIFLTNLLENVYLRRLFNKYFDCCFTKQVLEKVEVYLFPDRVLKDFDWSSV